MYYYVLHLPLAIARAAEQLLRARLALHALHALDALLSSPAANKKFARVSL